MFTVESLQEQIAAETKRWEELAKQLEQQFTMQQGAHFGRVALLEEQIKSLSEPESPDKAKDDE